MRGPGGARRDCVVYVGELPDDIREREVEDLFWDVRASCRLQCAGHPRQRKRRVVALGVGTSGAAGLHADTAAVWSRANCR